MSRIMTKRLRFQDDTMMRLRFRDGKMMRLRLRPFSYLEFKIPKFAHYDATLDKDPAPDRPCCGSGSGSATLKFIVTLLFLLKSLLWQTMTGMIAF
jgi:hypothetical protein